MQMNRTPNELKPWYESIRTKLGKLKDPRRFVERHFVEYDIWSNNTTGRMKRLVEMDSWSKLIFRRNMFYICLKLVENIKHLRRKKRKGNNFILKSAVISRCYNVALVFPIVTFPVTFTGFGSRLSLQYEYEDCSNMNASSFITFFTYMLQQNGKRFYKGLNVTFKLAPDIKKNTIYLSSYSPLNEGHISILTTQCLEHIPVI